MKIVGLMSGTSADGTDAVCAEIWGAPPLVEYKVLSHVSVPHNSEMKQKLFKCFRPETSTVDFLCSLNFELGECFAEAANAAIAAAGLTSADIDGIGSHGQTAWHIPPGIGQTPSTLQLGNPAIIAQRTGCTVVSDFRARDMAAGGQGAPLVPFVDKLLLSHDTKTRAVQNIGGIGNVTYLPLKGQEGVFGFDTGPGNMLIDYAANRATNGALDYDKDGALAEQGTIDEKLLSRLMADKYFSVKPPKSTGREYFGVQLGKVIYDECQAKSMSPCDIVATLTAFTAKSIAAAYRDFLPQMPDQVLLCGGGAYNPVLKGMLAGYLPECEVTTCDAVGLPSQAKESLAFAILAYETLNNRPGNLPSATGASCPVVLGSITYR